jgi:hypothetical protein
MMLLCEMYEVVTYVHQNRKVNDHAFFRRYSGSKSAFHWNDFGIKVIFFDFAFHLKNFRVFSPLLGDFLFYCYTRWCSPRVIFTNLRKVHALIVRCDECKQKRGCDECKQKRSRKHKKMQNKSLAS